MTNPRRQPELPIEGRLELSSESDFNSKDDAIAAAAGKVEPATEEADLQLYFHIPRQAGIECRALVGGGVEIWQEGQHGDAEDSIIHVAAGNVVQLARHLLYAAGFHTIGIYTHEKGGNVDVEDGHLASNFYEDDDKPGYGPVRPQ